MSSAEVRRVLFSLVVFGFAFLSVVACKDHADTARTTAQTCERVYEICPNGVPASPADAELCASAFTSRCGAELRQYVQCATGKCDRAGAIDRLAIEQACVATIEAYRNCEATDGGVRGSDEGQLPPFPIDAGSDG